MSDCTDDQRFMSHVMEATIRVGLLASLAAWCFMIVRPLIVPIVWGIIMAVASYPGYARLQRTSGGRQSLAASVFAPVTLVVR